MNQQVPAVEGTVTARIRAHRTGLQPALGRIADVVLAEPAAVAAMTIADVAAHADCSEATVVRFTKEIGYTGYRQFRFALHEETAQRAGAPAEVYATDIDPADDLSVVIAKIAAADARAAHDTVGMLDTAVLDAVAQHAVTARRILLVGVGASALPAQDLQQKLFRVGLPAVAYLDIHHGLPAAALLSPDDLCIAFSHSGRTAETLDLAVVAARSGAVTVAVTEAPRSVLARACDHVLVTAASESEVRSGATASRIAQLTVVDCLFMATVRKLPDLGRDALARTRAAVESRRTD